MTVEIDVVVIVGSLREGSINRKVAKALENMAPSGMRMEIVPIGDLALYNQDLDTAAPPRSWVVFRDRIRACHAVLFVTPEHNRSIPAALKNALEVGARPYGQNVWEAKPGALVSASPGLLGGSAASLHLRQVLTNVNVVTMQQPEIYLSGADKMFDDTGKLINEGTITFLNGFLKSFETWIKKFR